jgi:hypothetical protein
MMRCFHGSSPRNAATVFGAFSSSKLAVNENGPALMRRWLKVVFS